VQKDSYIFNISCTLNTAGGCLKNEMCKDDEDDENHICIEKIYLIF